MAEKFESVNQQSQNKLEQTNREVQGEQAPIQREPSQMETQPQRKTISDQIQEPQRPMSQDEALSFLDANKQMEAQQQEPAGQFATRDFNIGDAPPSWELDKQNDFLGIPHYDKYQGSAWDDFTASVYNAGAVRTMQGVANLIPAVASATTDAEWAQGWMDTVNDWADRNEAYVSQTGQKSFFDTWDVRSLAAGMGQGVGSMLPMIAASVATGGIGGAAGLIGGTGFRAGALAASATYGGAAGTAASAINMMPGLVEEGLANGLTHQQASALALSIAPIVGLMDKMGLDEAIKAGATAGKGGISKEVLNAAFSRMGAKGMVGKDVAAGSVKTTIGEIAAAHKRKIMAELAEEGITKGAKGYTRGKVGATIKGIAKEAGYRGKQRIGQTLTAGAKGSTAEAVTESLQSMIETAGKQIYDLQFAADGSTVGEGKFGADVMSKEAWMGALEEGFYGGLIGGSFSMAGAANKAVRNETIMSALDSANKRGRMDKEIARMKQVLEANKELTPEIKEDINNVIDTQVQMVRSMPSEVTNTNARHQIFQLSHFARELQDEIEQTDVENASFGMEDLAAAKKDKLEQRLADVKQSIREVYQTSLDGSGGRAIDLSSPIMDEKTGELRRRLIDDITGVAVQEKQGIMTSIPGGKPDAAPQVAEARAKKAEGQLGRLETKIQDFANRIAKGEQMTSPEDVQFYENNKQFIEERLKEMTQVPAVTPDEEVRINEEYEAIQNPLKGVQDEDMEYVNKAAEESHAQTFGNDNAVKVQRAVASVNEVEQAFDENLNVRDDLSLEEANNVIDKLVTARRALTEMLDQGDTPGVAAGNVDERNEQIRNADAFLRQKIQQAKAIKDKKSIQEGDVKQQKRIGDEQVKDTSKPDARAESTAREGDAKQETEGDIRQIEGTQPTQKVLGEAQPTADTEGEVTATTGQEAEFDRKIEKAKSLGFDKKNTWRHVMNSINKRLRERGEPERAVTKEEFGRLTDRQLEAYARMSESAKINQAVDQAPIEVAPAEKPAPQPKKKAEKPTGDSKWTMNDDQKKALLDKFKSEYFGKGKFSKLGFHNKGTTNLRMTPNFNKVMAAISKIFPDVDIEIMEKVIANGGLEVLGRVIDNKIEISESATQQEIFHELAHKFAPLLSGSRIWNRGIEMIKDTEFMEEARELYPELNEDEIAEEALMKLLGIKSEAMMQERVGDAMWPKVKRWLKQMWTRLKYVLNKATADDYAEMMAFDMAWKLRPVEGSGLKFGEKLSKFSTAEDLPNLTSIRAAAIQAKVFLRNNPEAAINGMTNDVFEYALGEAYNGIENAPDYTEWVKKYKKSIERFRNDLVSEFDSLSKVEEDEDMDDDTIEKMTSFLQGGTQLDDNVRSIIESLTDEYGNQIPTDRIYGILTHIAANTTDPSYFMSNIKKFADKTKGISSIDKNVANQLYEVLQKLPSHMVKPIQAQLSSMVNVPHISNSIDKKGGVWTNFSNRSLNSSEIREIMMERIVAAYNLARTDSGKKDTRKKQFDKLNSKLALARKWANTKEGNSEFANTHIQEAVRELRKITSLPVQADWFDTVTTTDPKKILQERVNQMNKFSDALQKAENDLNSIADEEFLTESLRNEAYRKSKKAFDSIVNAQAGRISQQLATSFGERSVFRNVMGNQQMGYRVGGWLHKLLGNKALLSQGLGKRAGISNVIPKELTDLYTQTWLANVANGNANMAHSDGLYNADTNEAIQFDRMNPDDLYAYQMETMLGSFKIIKDPKTGEEIVTYMNSMGTISNRKHQGYMSSPYMSTTQAIKAFKAIQGHITKDGIVATDAKMAESIKKLEDYLMEMSNENPKGFFHRVGKLAETSENEFYQEKAKEHSKEYLKEIVNPETGMSRFQEMYMDYLESQVGNIAEQIVYNEAVNRYVAKSLALGDMNKLKGSEDVLKRLAGATSPSVKIDLRKSPKDKQPATKIIVLEDIMTDGGTEASNSWGYFNDYIGQRIKEQGGSLIDYGRNYKPLINETNQEGEFTYIKLAGESFHDLNMSQDPQSEEWEMSIYNYHGLRDKATGALIYDTNGQIQLDRHGKVAVMMKKMQEKYPDQPVMVTFGSAVKSDQKKFQKNGKLQSIDEVFEAAEKGDFDNIVGHEEVMNNFGLQFNINKDVNKPNVDVALSTQLLNVITAGLPIGTDIKTFQDLLAAKTNKSLKGVEKSLNKKKGTVTRALEAAGNGVSSFVKGMINRIIDTSSDEDMQKMKFDQYDIGMVLQNYLASQTSKGVKHRVDGAELLQTVDLNNELKYMTQESKGQMITHAEVKVPAGFAEMGAELISVRIPLSNKINIVVAKVVGFTPPGGNKIIMPNGWIDASNADNDGDKMFTWKKSDNTLNETRQQEWAEWAGNSNWSPDAQENIIRTDIKGFDPKRSKREFANMKGYFYDADADSFGDVLNNRLFDEAMKLLRHPSLMDTDNKGYNEELDTKLVKEAVAQAEVEMGKFNTVQEAMDSYNEDSLSMGTMEDEIDAAMKMKESSRLIGIFAVGAKVINALSTAGANLKEGVQIPTFRQEDTDFAKAPTKGGKSKFTTEKISQVAETLQLALDNAKEVFMHRTGINSQNANMAVLLLSVGYDLKDVVGFFKHPAIESLTDALANNRSVVKGRKAKSYSEIFQEIRAEYSGDTKAIEYLSSYDKLKGQSEIIGLASTVTQLDKGVPKDSVSLMNVKGQIEKLKKYDMNLGDFISNPVVQARLKAIDMMEDIYEKYFTISSKDSEVTQAIANTLDSFDNASKNIDSRKKARIAQKVYSKTIAQKLSKYSYTPQSLQHKIQSVIDKVAAYKSGNNAEVYGFLDLIGTELQGAGTEWTPVRLIPTYRHSVPELDNSEDNNIAPEMAEELFNKLPLDLQEDLIEYAIHAEGLINEGKNISHLLPPRIFDEYFGELSKVDAKEALTEQFYDNIIREGRGDVKMAMNPWATNIEVGQKNLSSVRAKQKESKYFKVVKDGQPYIYKVVEQNYDKGTKRWSIDAELMISPEETFKIANRSTIQYATDTKGKVPYEVVDEGAINVDEPTTTPTQNEEAARAYAISLGLDYDMLHESNQGGNIDDSLDEDATKFQKMPTGNTNEDATKVNRRMLRRLSAKFNIPYKIINDPEVKVRGFYDAKTNTVVINEAYATADTALHEFAHPFITSIKQRNPGLYSSLVSELQNSQEGKAVLEQVKKQYANLDEAAQIEEAMVQLLGQLAADKITTPSLKQRLLDLWNQIVNTVKQLFGAQADIVQETMSPNTTLGDLAGMLLDTKNTISIDKQMDDRVRRALDYASRSVERMQKLFNPAVEIVKADDVVTPEVKSIRDKMAKAGFIPNNNFIVKRKGEALNGSQNDLVFRAPSVFVQSWVSEIRGQFPNAKVTQKLNSNIKGYDLYEVSLGDGDTAYFYKPKNLGVADVGVATQANIQFQQAAGSTAPGKNINTDKNVFNGLGFDTDAIEVSDTVRPMAAQERIAMIKGQLQAYLDEYHNGEMPIGKIKDPATGEEFRASELVIARLTNQIVENARLQFNKMSRKGQLSGKLDDVVNLNLISKLNQAKFAPAMEAYITNGDLNAALNMLGKGEMQQDFINSIQAFNKMVQMSAYLQANNNYLLSGDKRVSAAQVANDIITRSNEATSKREAFFNQFPIIKQIYNAITKSYTGLRKFMLGMFTPEVMANVVTGKEKNFLHQLVSDDMLKGDEKDAVFKDEMYRHFKEAMTPEVYEKLNQLTTQFGTDPKNVKTMAIKGLDSAVPMGKALSLYLALRQTDIREKARRKGSYTVHYKNDVTGKEVKADIDGDKFMNNFEAAIRKDKDLAAIISAIDSTMGKIYEDTSATATDFMGVPLMKTEAYFPTKYGSRIKTTNRDAKRRIEDFAAIKERSLENNPEIRMDDAFETMSGYINQASKFNAYAMPISNLRKLIRNIEAQDDYSNETHGATVEYIYDMIDSIQDYQQLESLSDASFNKQMRKAMNNFTLAVLGWNPAVALKQVVSVVAAVPELGWRSLTSAKGREASARILKNSYKRTKIGKGQIGDLDLNDPTLVEIMNLSPLMKQRFQGYIDRDQGEYRAHGMNPYSSEGKKTNIFGKKFDMGKTMDMIKIHDAAAIAFIYETIKEQNPNLKGDALKQRLEDVVNRTQPTYNPSSRTNLSRSNNLVMRLFTMFSSQRAKNMNLMMDRLLAYVDNPNPENTKAMKMTLMAIGVVSSIGIAVIDKLKYALFGGGEDDEDLLGAAQDLGTRSMMNTLGNFYFLGQFASMVEANYTNKPFGKVVQDPVLQTAGIAAKSIADLGKGDMWKAIDGGMQTSMRLIGAPLWPYTNIVRKGAKSIGSEGSSSSKSSGSKGATMSGSGDGKMTDVQKAMLRQKLADQNTRTQLIKAELGMRKAVMQLAAQKENRAARERAMRERQAFEYQHSLRSEALRREGWARQDRRDAEMEARRKQRDKARKEREKNNR